MYQSSRHPIFAAILKKWKKSKRKQTNTVQRAPEQASVSNSDVALALLLW